MEFIPRKPAAAQAVSDGQALDARCQAIRDIGVAAVAAALGLAEGAATHAQAQSHVQATEALPLAKAA